MTQGTRLKKQKPLEKKRLLSRKSQQGSNNAGVSPGPPKGPGLICKNCTTDSNQLNQLWPDTWQTAWKFWENWWRSDYLWLFTCIISAALKAITGTPCNHRNTPLSPVIYLHPVYSFSLQLEVELVQKEEKLLEMDLLYEHISQLTDRIRATAENGKQDTLLLAKRVRRALHALLAGLYKMK